MSLISRMRTAFRGRCRLGLVLGSGGARGLAHIGVLKVLEGAGIPLHCVVGSSAGAMVGGLYCAGTSPAKLGELFGNFSRKDVARILMPTMGAGGIVDGRRVMRIIRPLAGGKSIEGLSPRFACVATDLLSGRRVVFNRGDLMYSIRASISIPGLFTPVICGDRVLVDGGVVDPLPIRLAFDMGATCAIVVRVGSRFYFDSPPAESECVFQSGDAVAAPGERVKEVEEGGFGIAPRIVGIVLSTLAIFDYRLSEVAIRSAGNHILVEPQLPDVEMLDFHKGKEVIAAGEETMRAHLDELKRLSL